MKMTAMTPLTFEAEDELASNGYCSVCGIDEAGRGPLAGNVVAAAVILPHHSVLDGLNDSKKLTPKRREALFDSITACAIYGIGEATPEEIDQYNILCATMIAMHRAVAALSTPADFALIDGNRATGFSIPVRCVVGGDGKVPSIAAASILAKVTRDRECLQMDKLYPQYGFAIHKGYPTKQHMQLLREIGPCPLHRKSFLRFLNHG